MIAPPICPKCGSRDVRPAYVRSLDQILASILNLKPFRCRSCRKRFYYMMRKERLAGHPDAE